MSQRSAEIIIGRLATDEGLRRRFRQDPDAALEQLAASGLVLNPCERRALAALDPDQVEGFARALDPCIQKIELPGERSCGCESQDLRAGPSLDVLDPRA